GGTHHLRTPVTKGHNQPFTVLPVPAWSHGWARPAAPPGPVTIVGQLCTPKDVLARDVQVPGCAPGTWSRSAWPAPAPGTSHTTTSSCTPSPASITWAPAESRVRATRRARLPGAR